MLFGLLPGTSQAEQTQMPPVADAHAAETPLDAVPATQTPTELTEAETVSLSENEIRVIKGGTTTLTAEIPEAERGESPLTTASGIVWTSSNPAVATVDSNGVVTGIELGEATITATLNGSVIETFSVYSTLANGYYVLEPYSALFTLAASSISMEDSTGIEPLSYDYEEESLQTVIGDVWYIQNVGGAYYSIHPAFSRGMAIALPNSNNVALYKTTNLTAHKWHWQIESVSGSYIFRNRYYTNTTFAAGGEDENYYIETATINTSNSSQRWDYFSPILVPGMLLFDLMTGDLLSADFGNSDLDYDSGSASAVIQRNSPHTLEEISLSVQIIDSSESQTYTMTFSPSYAAFNLSTLEITGSQIGTTTATISRSTSSGLKSLSFELTISPDRQILVFNYYDDSFPSTIRSYISGAIDFVNNAFTYSGHSEDYLEVYDRIFVDTGFRRNYVLYDDHYTGCSHSDGCVNDVNYCGLDCNNHHKNLERISTTLDAMNQENTLQVLWTNRPLGFFCSNSSTDPTHRDRDYYALVREDASGFNRQVIHMMNTPETTTSNITAFMSLTLAHEVAHTLGLDEESDNPGHDQAGRTCIMEQHIVGDNIRQFYNNVYNGDVSGFCNSCISKLTQLLL